MQALSKAGSHRLLHWCGLLLYVHRGGLPIEDDPLVLLAQRRAHFRGEAIDAMADGSRSLAAAAQLTGTLSLMRLAYHMELRSFVEGLPVWDFIRVAILNGGGVLGGLLSVPELLELADMDAATVGLQRLTVSPAGVWKVVGCY